jgi:hypothetical protein
VSNSDWYPDPGGRPGQFRYWDGSGWSEQLTTNPNQEPPPGSGGKAKSAIGWWIAGIAVVLVLGVGIWAVIRYVPSIAGSNPWAPSGETSSNFCSAGATQISPSARPTKSGWVTSGHLSFPQLGAPWRAPKVDNRVPFGVYGMGQDATDQTNYDGNGASWVSSVLVADLDSGDGFASSEVAANVALTCVLGAYYSDTKVTKNPISAGPHSVDGHTGWLVEAQLAFSVPGLNTKGERVLLLVVQVANDRYSMFYASVPDTSSDRLPEARKTLASLKVDP